MRAGAGARARKSDEKISRWTGEFINCRAAANPALVLILLDWKVRRQLLGIANAGIELPLGIGDGKNCAPPLGCLLMTGGLLCFRQGRVGVEF